MKNGTFCVKLLWILFGQLLGEHLLLFNSTSGHTGSIIIMTEVLSFASDNDDEMVSRPNSRKIKNEDGSFEASGCLILIIPD